jgi:IS30 family transposase
MRISHEAIYQALYVETRGALKRDLVSCLRRGRALRVPRARTRSKAWAHVTPETLISQRPPEVAELAVPGHWEGDLLIGPQRSAMALCWSAAAGLPCWSTFHAKSGMG